MQQETNMRSLCENLLQATQSILSRRGLPLSGHEAASSLYDVVDEYTQAVIHNQRAQAKAAAQKVAVEALRVYLSYELPKEAQNKVHVDKVSVSNRSERFVDAK